MERTLVDYLISVSSAGNLETAERVTAARDIGFPFHTTLKSFYNVKSESAEATKENELQTSQKSIKLAL